ncbi:MAG TPA: cache domain-containing protein, partial [Ktedonobacteraceae bacterium]|nr:cache domain-containing protein [Ktedonobacteraceae bacterium]
MLQFMRRSLLIQLLSIYLLFVIIVLLAGLGANTVVEQKLRNDVQTSDQALAQEIALETSLHLQDAQQSLVALGTIALHAGTPDALKSIFHTFHDARSDVDQVSWLDPVGTILVSWPPGKVSIGAEFSPPSIVQRALNPDVTSPVFEVGIAEETTFAPDVIIAEPVRTNNDKLVGLVVASLSLAELSDPLRNVVDAQHRQDRRLQISIIDSRGELIATPDQNQILWS